MQLGQCHLPLIMCSSRESSNESSWRVEKSLKGKIQTKYRFSHFSGEVCQDSNDSDDASFVAFCKWARPACLPAYFCWTRPEGARARKKLSWMTLHLHPYIHIHSCGLEYEKSFFPFGIIASGYITSPSPFSEAYLPPGPAILKVKFPLFVCMYIILYACVDGNGQNFSIRLLSHSFSAAHGFRPWRILQC